MRVILQAHVREEAVDEAKAFFQNCLLYARVYEGCLHSNIFQNENEPTLLLMVEDWETQEHHKKYLAWYTKTGRLRELIRYLSGPPNLQYFKTLEV